MQGVWVCNGGVSVRGVWPGHEEQVGALARELGFRHVSLSSAVAGMVRAVPRGYTACADAYLTPCIHRYLESFRAGFAHQLRARGHDTARHVLACFGGAGGQHACAIARALGMSRVFIHKYSGILSAYGLALADVVHEAQAPCALRYEPAAFPWLDGRIAALERECRDALRAQGFTGEQIRTEAFLHLRYEGTDCALMCSAKGHPPTPRSCRAGDFHAAFTSRYLVEFGFTIPDRAMVVDDVRVRGTGSSGISCETPLAPSGKPARVETVTRCYFEEGYLETPVFLLEELACDHTVPGPAIIIDKNSPGERGGGGMGGAGGFGVGWEPPPEGLPRPPAEQMGRILQRTAISTNIKERLGFSCALFGPDGGLVSNAPHIPVHLGAMQETVQFQIRNLGADLREGDVILSNHPCAGGSHLPDLTVITPVFWPGVPKPVFFVASRGHHADIGGITPGSMPPHSKALREEGAVFVSFKLVKDGVFQEEGGSALGWRDAGSAVFDFSGSGPEVYGNCNAPRAITLSALIYCLRCMVGQDIPLNQGCLAPVRVVIPKGSILDPSPEAAVVGGNVLTSQRVVDVIFRAFGVCAASQCQGFWG
ncbi:PREDICTED: 5-oxoprolinase [Nipponia nippon]|uniref:5-oxoprolinase n=1 Tax=Nipponia nippon TaxID=128390 RepID=UPI0005107F9D|nr:PREDICTED: 5-oxoprolinase [Nipponia nippon]